LTGQQTTTREQIHSIQRTLLDNPRLGIEQQNELSGKLLQLEQVAASTQEKLMLVRDKEQELTLRAEQAGRVMTWQVRDLLLHRPVQKGQALIAVVDPEAEWELELYVPERHIGYLHESDRDSNPKTSVSFMLSSHPGQHFRGRLLQVDRTAASWADDRKSVRVRVSVDRDELPELLNEATVMAKLHCGQRSLGYAWFHDLIDALRGQLAFWWS